MPQATDRHLPDTDRSRAARRLRLLATAPRAPRPDRLPPMAACPISPSAAWGFDATDPAAVPLCRRTARAVLAAWRLGESGTLVDDATLVVSELSANVYRHVGSSIATIRLTWYGALLSIWVHDRSPVLPRALPEPREGACGWDWTGWGLTLVEAIAAGYGGSLSAVRDPDGRGKSVGVALPIDLP